MTKKMFQKLVLTGAAGRLGSYLREPLSTLCEELVSTDLADGIGTTYQGETYQSCDLSDFAAVQRILAGADIVVHFGGQSDEAPWDDILHSNIIGSYNVFEAAYRHGARRVVYASSIHAVGMYPKQEFIGTDVPKRPDGLYGLSKCFVEDLGRLFWEKRGLESVHLRILSCAKVGNTRALSTWLSYDDLIQLVTRSIDTPTVGFTVAYGVSANDRTPVDNSAASFLGYRPRDNAEQFAATILAQADAPDPADPAQTCHGGPFAVTDLGQSGQAFLNIVDDRKET